MTSTLRGNAIEYEIEEFVASGQESIVYKARVKSTQRCVALKFRRKESLGKFRKKELPIYQNLDHLNIIKIFDYIDNIGNLRLEKEIGGVNYVIDRNDYYCVVEDFVTGEVLKDNESSSLKNYCLQRAPKKEASYEDVIKFQEDFVFKWIMEFCDIMTHMTREKRILHLDIKPENIMVTRTGSIVLIDMGLSGFMEKQSTGMNLQYDSEHIHKDLSNVERRYITLEGENILVYVYGTPGFAAPECYYKDGRGNDLDETLKNPFVSGRAKDKDGIVDARSDIFSFGCVLWDIIHLGGYGADDNHKDYAILKQEETKDGYFRRDLHFASPYYLQELEDIILKCTEEDPDQRYQDYEELKKAALRAKKYLPKSEESNKKNKILRGAAFTALMLAIIIFIIFRQGLGLEYEIAYDDFRVAARNYSGHTLIDFRDATQRLLETASTADFEQHYQEIIDAVKSDGNVITSAEFREVLHRLLGSRSINDSVTVLYINTAMQNPREGNDIRTLSNFIESNYRGADCDGYMIAEAIANSGKDTAASYNTLISYQDHSDYNVALNELARMLLSTELIRNDRELRVETEAIVKKTEVE